MDVQYEQLPRFYRRNARAGHRKAAMDYEKVYPFMLKDGEVEEPDSEELLAAIRLEHLSYH